MNTIKLINRLQNLKKKLPFHGNKIFLTIRFFIFGLHEHFDVGREKQNKTKINLFFLLNYISHKAFR